VAKDPLPSAEVVAENLGHADRAKSEPSYQLSPWVAEVILDEQLMAEIVPGYDVEKLLEILTAPLVPLVAA